MVVPLSFQSSEEYRERLEDVAFWRPYIEEILTSNELVGECTLPLPGVGSTYPTFIVDELVVKMFGFLSSWSETLTAEKRAHALLAGNSKIKAPGIVSTGALSGGSSNLWKYMVTTRMKGVAWDDAQLSSQKKLKLATQLGHQIKCIHSLPTEAVLADFDWSSLDLVAAAERSCLPDHLTSQVEKFVSDLDAFDCVFTHSDLIDRHVFVDDDELTGIIDWGDAIIADRHYELTKLYLDLFRCDKALLRAFLKASDWPVGDSFSRQALGMSLYRQAVGLRQHLTFDAFHLVCEEFPLQDIGTLEELADELFDL